MQNQQYRPLGVSRGPRWIGASAAAGAAALHALPVVALLMIGAARLGDVEEAAITVFVEPGGAPVATATERAAASQLNDALPPPEPTDSVPDFRPPTPPPELSDVVPPPEATEPVAPDFHQKPPPKPEPRKPPPPTQKAEPKASAPPMPPRAAAPAPSPSSAAPSANSAAAAPPAPSPGQAGGAATVAPGWNALVAAWLAAHRRYPEEARRRSVEGDVTVRFSVAADGRVTDVSVVSGSGSSALDTAATAILQGASLPAPGSPATRTVRIRYRLSD
jgi:periplasmic protein TonB